MQVEETKQTEMIDLRNLQDIIELTLWSAYIKDERPLNLLIIAKPERGKTELLKKYYKNKGIACLTDCTAYGITKYVLPDIQKGDVHHLIIPDFLDVTSRKESTVRTLITFLNSLIEEGVSRIETYAFHFTVENLRCGLITAIPLKILQDKRYRISDLTFLSRMIPFSYDYSQKSVRKILESIVKKEYYSNANISLKFPKRPKKISTSKELNEQLIPLTEEITKELELHGFRLLKQLSVLAMSNALRCKRQEVTQRDIELVKHLSHWINFRQKDISKEWSI